MVVFAAFSTTARIMPAPVAGTNSLGGLNRLRHPIALLPTHADDVAYVGGRSHLPERSAPSLALWWLRDQEKARSEMSAPK